MEQPTPAHHPRHDHSSRSRTRPLRCPQQRATTHIGPAEKPCRITRTSGDLPSGTLNSIACTTTSTCIAGGTSNGYDSIDTLANGTWTVQDTPTPAGTLNTGTPTDHPVACDPTDTCIAVASYTDAQWQRHGLIDTYTSGTWTPSAAPWPANAVALADDTAYPDLWGATCPTQGTCTAFGDYTDAADTVHGAIATLHNGTWTALAVPTPAGTARGTTASFTHLACNSTGCLAIGTYTNGLPHPMLAMQTHGTWTAYPATWPANINPDYPYAANETTACTPTGSCVAAGSYVTTHGHQGMLTTITLPH